MKAGILTLHQADNYGAVLQAYALQQTLLDLGLDNEILTTDFPDPSPVADRPAAGAAAVLMKRVEEENRRRREGFAQFRSRYLKCSEEYKKTELSRADEAYDLFITGSDQVWNMNVLGADACYFLPFTAPEKRFSYAASFGGEKVPENMTAWCAEQLAGFARISTREAEGQEYVKELTGRDADVCLDPVFLPGKEGWQKLLDQEDPARLLELTEGRPYYVLYMLFQDEALMADALQTASEQGAALKVISASFLPRFGFDAWSRIGVTDWLMLFANAEGVFTNSFHGTAFALMFGKPLSVTGPKGRFSKKSGRIRELLRRAGMEAAYDGRLTNAPEAAEDGKLQNASEAGKNGKLLNGSETAVMKRLEPEREASLCYLREVISYAETL